MNALKSFSGLQISRTKLALLSLFSVLLLGQILIGFRNFEDYLIVFIFALFINDLYIKMKRPDLTYSHDEKIKRSVMTALFLALFTLPFLLDAFNISNGMRLFLYRLGFLLWAQVFLLDAFTNYRQTQSRRWLLITNMAVLLIIVGAFAAH
jgi:hypothetical protein